MVTTHHLPAGSHSHVVRVGDHRIHCVEAGEGPLVLLVHGFPESWYSWRHQIPALAAAGYRTVAIDVRGYGRSSKPLAVDDYRMVRLVADNVGLVSALGAETATIIGHDWGAPIAWNSAMLRPDVFTAVAGLSVPFAPPSDVRPLAAMRAMAGDEEFYIEYFQEPGRAEAEIEADVRDWLLGFMFSGSGDAPVPDPSKGTIATIPRGALMKDRFSRPDVLPPWLTEEDLDVYTDEFEHSGLRGPLNRYRNVDRDFEDLAAFRGARIDVPALFIGGDRDGPTVWGAPAIAAFDRTLPRLHRSIVLDGCGHWTQQERPGQVNEALVDFLGSLPASPHSPHQTDLGATMPRTSRSSAVAWRACSPHAPDALLADPQVMQAALVAHSQKDQRPPAPRLGPDRDEFLAVMARAMSSPSSSSIDGGNG